MDKFETKRIAIYAAILAVTAIVTFGIIKIVTGNNKIETIEEASETAENVDVVHNIDDDNISGVNSDVTNTGIYGIDAYALKKAIEGTSMSTGFNNQYSEASLINDTDGKYMLYKVYSAVCEPETDSELVHDGFRFEVSMQYSGEDRFPSQMSILYDYENSNDDTVGQGLTRSVMNELAGKQAGDVVFDIPLDKSTYNITENEDFTVFMTASKGAKDSSAQTRVIYDLTIEPKNKTYEVGVDSFNTSEFPDTLLVKSGLVAANSTLSSTEKAVANIFDAGKYSARTKCMSHSKHSNDESDTLNAEAVWVISDIIDSSERELAFTAKSDAGGEYFKVTFSGECADKDKAVTEVEKIVRRFANTDIDSDKLKETGKISSEVSETEFNFGCPLKIECSLTGGSSIDISVTIESVIEDTPEG